MARIIVYDGREHEDPDPANTIEGIKDIMSTFYPDIATATFKTEKRDSDTLYIFTKQLGTKGTTTPESLAEAIKNTPTVRLEALGIFASLATKTGSIPKSKLDKFLGQNPKNMEHLENSLHRLAAYIVSVHKLTDRLLRPTDW